MKATEAALLVFLKKSDQFVIPIYQRTYSWGERECRQLWNDIISVGKHLDGGAHFVGSIVYIQDGIYQASTINPILVIDGQQRLTTVMLLLEALARYFEDHESLDIVSAEDIRGDFLVNERKKGNDRFKLLLTQSDRETLCALVTQKDLPTEPSIRMTTNFELFGNWISALGLDLASLWRGLSRLILVDVSLDREHDNPQLIFESMNSTGKELSQADLIRNFVLMGLEHDLQTQLYKEHWHRMEQMFGQTAYDAQFDSFMRHYLTIKTGEIPNVRGVYEAFKRYANNHGVSALKIETLVADIHTFAEYYCAMALGREEDKVLAEAFDDLRELKVNVAYPLLLQMYGYYRNGMVSRDDLAGIVRLIESYVFRRAICNIPTNSLDKTFITLTRAVQKERCRESLQAALLLQPTSSYRRFPNDVEFESALIDRDVYNFPRRTYMLRRLENFGRKERVVVEEYTIEHIMPQNPNLSLQWRQALGPDWDRVHNSKLHTLGNLTLTGYNSEYSDRPFEEKRDMKGGFRQSPLSLNQELGQLEIFDANAIERRAKRLAEAASLVWAFPCLHPEILKNYDPKPARSAAQYSIADHNFLAEGTFTRKLFDELRREILALDPCITEEFLKLYVAYKAETNFVDIVPLSQRLRLSLNMPFSQLHDPRAIAKDVTSLGRWGNGDVEVVLESYEQVPYLLGLIRQSLERQMGRSELGV